MKKKIVNYSHVVFEIVHTLRLTFKVTFSCMGIHGVMFISLLLKFSSHLLTMSKTETIKDKGKRTSHVMQAKSK